MKTIDTTTENNKLIAEFMGVNFKVNEFEIDFNSPLYPKVLTANNQYWDERDSDFDLNPYQFLRFKSSYDWLIPVVEKISNLPNFLYPDGIFANLVSVKIQFDTNCVEIIDMYKENFGGEGFHCEFFEKSTLENIYHAVTSFIKWYNENK